MATASRIELGQDFDAFVEALAVDLVGRSATFAEFVAALPGVLPDEALAALRRLPRAGQVDRLIADAGIDRAPRVLDQVRRLPLPHPLDHEFRFDDATARNLAAELIGATRDGDEILLVGAPTIALTLAELNVDRLVRFVGPDNCVTAAVAAAFDDGRLRLGEGTGATASAALADPPWYVDPAEAMIGTCARGCRTGAHIWLVIPPVGTKAEATSNRRQFLAVATAFGMEATGEGSSARYRTPLFELAAMERQGLARLEAWRRGDVAILAQRKHCGESAIVPIPIPCELAAGGVRLRLLDASVAMSEDLVPIAGDEVFPSVSSRAAGRNLATLWTTSNRAFQVNPALARSAFATIARQREAVLHGRLDPKQIDPDPHTSVAAPIRLIHQLAELIGREHNEARRLVGDGAWLETAMDWRY